MADAPVPDALILDYVRTPRGKASATGSLHDRTATDLLIHLQHALIDRTGLDPARIDDVIVGCASQVDEQGADIARTSALLAGWGDHVPGVTINRFCASGIDAVAHGAARLRAGDLSMAVAGGVESVSRVPLFADRGPLWTDPATIRAVGSVHMGIAADLNATIEGLHREDLDAYGAETQQKAAAAWAGGRFAHSVVGVPPGEHGPGLDHDELVRGQTTLAALAELPPAFAQLGADGQDAIALNAYPGVTAIEHLHTVGTSPQNGRRRSAFDSGHG
jgi:acetyl-CoA C-acetyltransferase